MADKPRPAYYNEIEPFAAQWLRNLIAAGHLPAGDVDERSIEDVTPGDLAGYGQCHFFAGIGGWPLALRLIGWPDDRPIWTGSCPCQPFSAAGKGVGFADERHLWPSFHWLIQERRPAIVVGEQVASKNAEPWIDLVRADMEAMAYAIGAVAFPATGIGAPHIRDRNYWCGVGQADTDHARLEGWKGAAERAAERPAWSRGVAGGMADAHRGQQQGFAVVRGHVCNGEDAGRQEGGGGASARGGAERLAHSDCGTGEQERAIDGGRHSGSDAIARPGSGGSVLPDGGRAGPLHGFWGAADWLACRDGKWRPVEPGTQPLAHGVPGRVGRLRAYGNAIVPQQAAEFLIAALGR